MKYMYIGNRHQRQWWICFSVWATWQRLMGLIRQAAGTGSRLHRWVPCVPLSSVSAGCDLVSRVHCPENWTGELNPGYQTYQHNIKCRQAEAWWKTWIWRSNRKVVIKQCSLFLWQPLQKTMDIQNGLPDGTKPLSSMLTVRSNDIHLRSVSQDIFQPTITNFSCSSKYSV